MSFSKLKKNCLRRCDESISIGPCLSCSTYSSSVNRTANAIEVLLLGENCKIAIIFCTKI